MYPLERIFPTVGWWIFFRCWRLVCIWVRFMILFNVVEGDISPLSFLPRESFLFRVFIEQEGLLLPSVVTFHLVIEPIHRFFLLVKGSLVCCDPTGRPPLLSLPSHTFYLVGPWLTLFPPDWYPPASTIPSPTSHPT